MFCTGSLAVSSALPSPALAATVSSPHVIVLHSRGVAKLHFPGFTRGAQAPLWPAAAPDMPCEGLNGSRLVSGAFEVQAKGHPRAAAKLHALTAEGELLSLGLGSHFHGPCRVRVGWGMCVPVSTACPHADLALQLMARWDFAACRAHGA